MILVRAPLRISFIGGGTDLPDFHRRYPGRVVSATIDKYVYILINPTPLIDKFTVKYQKTELVNHPSELEHTRIKAALLKLGLVNGGLEIGSFADLPAKTGLGSSSSFSVALMSGLQAHLGKSLNRYEAAEAACDLEINLLREPIGKQDQYAAAFGGLNLFQFNPDGSVDVEPIFLDYRNKIELEEHLLLFFTGITREASSVLGEQTRKIDENFGLYKDLSDSVLDFYDVLLRGDIKLLGEYLHRGWLKKKKLASGISNQVIDSLYGAAMSNGAFGGKVLGAGGGGCLLFVAPTDKHQAIRAALEAVAQTESLNNFREIPFRFSQSGTDILINDNHGLSFT